MGRKPSRKPRFNAENTKGAAEIFAEQRAKPIELSRPCAPKTEEDRKRAIQAWHDFISHVAQKEAVHDHVWEWLAGDDLARQNEAMALCKTFLHCLVSTSTKPKLVWGPEEQCEEQGLKAVTSVNTYWKTLVAGAQAIVLDKMATSTGREVRLARKQGPLGAKDDGPVAKVTQWMMTDLRQDLNLTVDSGYEKVAATCKDIERLVKTLWERADDIPMSPYNRVTVHIYLLILFFSGCRPGMLEKIMWDDVKICLVHEPSVPSGRRLLVRLTITFNKQDRVQVKETERVTIDLAQMPTLLLDTTHLLAVKALHQDAFKHGYQTVDEMLMRPRLGTAATHLEWKEGLRNQRFFTMSDDTFRGLFKRLCLVSGLETPPRPYFLRVGAGANLEDAGLPLPTICQVIGHTLQVHSQSYQAARVRYDLQEAAFREYAGSENETLFKQLDQAWKAYDPDAPIYMTKAQRLEMEQRRDTTAKKEAIRALEENGGDKKERRRLTVALNTHRKRLEELAILARRERFFRDKESSLQAGGPENRDDREEEHYTGLTGTRSHADVDIRGLMQAWAPGTIFDAGAERRAIAAMEWMGNYLSSNRSAISASRARSPLREPSPSAGGPAASQLAAGKQSMCLVCGAAFARRADMTKHAAKHIALLSRQFSCPLCGETTCSPSEFSNHVERKHGKEHAPHFVTGQIATPTSDEARPKDRIPCAICHCDVVETRFLQHFNSKHATAFSSREATLSCAACPDQQAHNLRSWFGHLADRHGVPVAEQCPFCDRLFQARGLGVHIRKAHFESSGSIVSCPLCTRAGKAAPYLTDHASWLIHVQTAGHLCGQQPMELYANAPHYMTGTKRKAEDDSDGPGCAVTQVQPPPSKVQRRDGKEDPRAPLSPEPMPEASPSPLDFSLIDPALLGSSLSDSLVEGDDQTSLFGPSPQSLGGSTACTSPTTEIPSPIVAPEKLAAAIAEIQRDAEVPAKWGQDDPGFTAATSSPCPDMEDDMEDQAPPCLDMEDTAPPCLDMEDQAPPCLDMEDTSPPCLDMEDAQPSSAFCCSAPEQGEEIVLDTIYVAAPPITQVDPPLRRSQRRTRRRVVY